MWNLGLRRFYSHVQTHATKWRFSHSATNARQSIHERHSTPKLRAPVQRLHAPIILTDPTKSQRSPSCFTTRAKSPQHEYKGSVVVLGMWSPSALTSDSASASASCMRSALLFNYSVRSLPQCASLLSPMPLKMSSLLITALHQKAQCASALITLYPPKCASLRGMACLHETREGGVYACSASF